MKKIFNSFVIVAMMAAVGTTSSCTKTCDAGYEGDNCKTEVRTKYLGNFNGTEVSTLAGTSQVAVNILTVPSDVNKVTFNNLYDAGFNTSGTVQSDGTINIPSQTFGTGQISGNAVIASGKVKVTYTVTNGAADAVTWTQN